VSQAREAAILCGLSRPDGQEEARESMLELERLAETAGAEVRGSMLQARKSPDPATYFGEGKVAQMLEEAKRLDCGLLLVDDELRPSQQRNLEEATGLKVLDRTQLILDIFAGRARTGEGKLQVELAQLSYLLPRLVGMGRILSRLGGGIGTRGPGESKLESDRRRLRERIGMLGREIDELSRTRGLQRAKRRKSRAFCAALAGYTNAGKSSLFNALTGGEAYVKDQLFATLDPTVRPVKLERPGALPLLLSDTVGFIRRLPHSLVAAFRATLEEISEADLILRVLDASSPNFEAQLATVDEVLEEIFRERGQEPLASRQSLLVFNKVDLLSAARLKALKEAWPKAHFVSALEGKGLRSLAEALLAASQKGLKVQNFFFPAEKAGLLAKHFEALSVRKQSWTKSGLKVEAVLKSPVAELEEFKVGKAVKA
jgi:GTP-binding protein HflX